MPGSDAEHAAETPRKGGGHSGSVERHFEASITRRRIRFKHHAAITAIPIKDQRGLAAWRNGMASGDPRTGRSDIDNADSCRTP